jgi:DNA-binding NarL/FixJ family response regulator
MSIGVVLADDHPILRQGLKSLLEQQGFAVLGDASDGHEAIKLAQKHHPDVAVLDYSMPLLNGVDAAKEILQAYPRTKVIMLTVHRDDQYVLEALRAGVKGYVLKAEAATALVEAIREVCRGNVYLSPGISRAVVEACLSRGGHQVEILSPRELQVLRLVGEGHTMREIAEQLQITVKTAESYRTCLMEKLDLHNTANLVRYAVRRGLVKP